MKNAALFVFLLVGGCDDVGVTGPCAGVSGTCVSFGKNATEAAIQTALGGAKKGSTFIFAAGDFKFSNELTVTTDNVTIKGAGMDMTILDFTDQTAGSEGMLAMNSGFTISDLTVQNAKGNGVKVVGATGVTFQKVHVLWTNPDNKTHGPYALYPVQCTNVLIEDCTIEGAADAGIYVGQSEQIVVRRNLAKGNVAGVEIENSHFADVYNNESHDNTAGILVFALPDLQIKDNHDVRLHDNMIHDNNTDNFSATGSTVSIVPRGTGTFVMSASNVEVFNNTYSNNKTGNFAIISYLASGTVPMDTEYLKHIYPFQIYVHDNTFMGGGDAPDPNQAFPSIGYFLVKSLAKFPGMKVGDIMWDGLIDQTITGTNPQKLCLANNGAATFLDLHFDQLDTTDGFVAAEGDATPYQCTLPSVAPVTFPGLK